MLGKKDERGKCPLNNFKPCRKDCVLYRTGTRFNEATNEVYPVELCAFNVMADNMEAMHQRTFGVQAEIGELKTVTAFHVMANLGLTTKDKAVKEAERILVPIAEKLNEEEKDEKNQLPEK